MNDKTIDLIGKVCPFCVMHIIREVGKMQEGEALTFYVDDPLATKSVPEELEEDPRLSLEMSKQGKHWEISVSKS